MNCLILGIQLLILENIDCLIIYLFILLIQNIYIVYWKVKFIEKNILSDFLQLLEFRESELYNQIDDDDDEITISIDSNDESDDDDY